MSSIPHDHAGHGHDHAGHDESYLAPKATWFATFKDWATTIDHKKIGVMYMTAILFMFFIGGMAALLVRIELWEPTKTLINAQGIVQVEGQLFAKAGAASVNDGNEVYNRVFTLHGLIMVFLVIVPSIPASLGNFLLPLMLGAKDVAFPKLNLLSWYIYLLGSVFAVMAAVMGGVDTGWTFYTPYSTSTDEGHARVVYMILAAFILGFSSILTGLNFVVTVHKLRAPGMGWFDMPLFVWGIYGTALIQVLATPVIGITLLLLTFERLFHVGIFDPRMGGDPVLFQHFFWFYSHPVVYVMILPGMAVMSEVIAVFSRKKVFGYRAVAFSSLAIAGISFIVWGHHMFTSEGELAATIFSALTFLVALPSAVKVFNWTVTLYKGSIDLKVPMLYGLGFLFIFSIGGLTGIYLGALSTDIHLHDTYFVVAHFHYVMMGSAIIMFIAGIHMWWPKMFGKMYNENGARIGFWLVFIGFNLTFFPQFFMGAQGMPRRYASYVDEFQIYHQISTIGALVMASGFVTHLAVFIASLTGGRKAPPNPWGALSMEWTHAASPPITHNFHHEPVAEFHPYDFDDVYPPQCPPGEFAMPPKLEGHAKGHH